MYYLNNLLWFVVNTDLTITTVEVSNLFSTMKDDEVDYVGIWLDLPQSERDKVKRSYSSASQRREAYIKLYVDCHPYPSWCQISQTLHNVGLHQQADLVDNTYIQGTCMSYWSRYIYHFVRTVVCKNRVLFI